VELVSRVLAIPANPRTAKQTAVRLTVSRIAARWRALQEAQRAAWVTAAKSVLSSTRLGQSGPLSEFRLVRLGGSAESRADKCLYPNH
jgi:hypothetical protein